MLYKGLTFPSEAKLPYFYSNFVMTIDGKVQVLRNTNAYWPLGSELDYKTLIELRTYAGCLIHGARTALAHPTIHSLSKQAFHDARHFIGKNEPIWYVVVTAHPTDALIPKVTATHENVRVAILTTESATVSPELTRAAKILRIGKNTVDLAKLPEALKALDIQHVLVEGGPTLMGSFFQNNLIDELFVTIAPKIIGNNDGATLTMAEGFLFPPQLVPEYSLVSCKIEGNELYLRYRKHEKAT